MAVALANAVACYHTEEYRARGPARKEEAKEFKAKDEAEAAEQACTYRALRWCQMKREQNKVGTWAFVFLYFAANAFVFAFALNEWIPKGKALGLSGYGPFAKVSPDLSVCARVERCGAVARSRVVSRARMCCVLCAVCCVRALGICWISIAR